MKTINEFIKSIVLVLFCMLLSTGVKSQIATNLATAPIYVPPSPNASSLALFADYPVSQYTGIPEISIPIYELNVDNFKMPITLNYHSSGIRISQEASWVGLGWALNAGGSISRTVRGIDDFAKNGTGGYGTISNGYYYSPDINYYMSDYYNSQYYDWKFKLISDQEPDIFSFSLPTASGKFLLDKSRGPILFDKSSGVKIVVNESTISTENTFTIITPDGTQYVFDKKEISNVSNNGRRLSNGEYQRYDVSQNNYDDSQYTEYVSTWLLSKVILTSKKEINFSYIAETYTSPAQESCLKYNQIPGDYSGPGCMTETFPQAGTKRYSSNMEVISSFRLNAITWDNGRIDFTSSSRSDMKVATDGPQELSSVTVKNNSD